MSTAPSRTEQNVKPARRLLSFKRVLGVIALATSMLVVMDLFGPLTTRMREFDPNQVARLDTAMWRSYYARERLKLFNQLSELLRSQYRLPFVRSNFVAYQAAKAAFVFKDGHNREEYEKALPNLISFYTSIRAVSDIGFDVEKAARLELEWWIIHRERKQHAPGDLERALANLAGELYQMPSEAFVEHARLRAEAMEIRDTKAEQGGVTEEDWARIDELLHASWQSLHNAVNSNA
ncbi:MAG TPA: hypothetical protein VJQ56_14880 [Blastocatellia bacterium]|nr:hypothetical protein [Blastocatellia bacterium]